MTPYRRLRMFAGIIITGIGIHMLAIGSLLNKDAAIEMMKERHQHISEVE